MRTGRRGRRLLLALCGLVVLPGCSFQHRFFVVNTTDEAISVEIELTEPRGFPIFRAERCMLYDQVEAIDRSVGREVEAVKLPGARRYRVELPARAGLQIGVLSNQTYRKHDQQFINDRTFNLRELTVIRKGVPTTIVPSTFDQYFTKDGSRSHSYRVR